MRCFTPKERREHDADAVLGNYSGMLYTTQTRKNRRRVTWNVRDSLGGELVDRSQNDLDTLQGISSVNIDDLEMVTVDD